MDYGADMQTCIPMKTWFTQSVLATIPETGSLHRFRGIYAIFIFIYIYYVFFSLISWPASTSLDGVIIPFYYDLEDLL